MFECSVCGKHLFAVDTAYSETLVCLNPQCSTFLVELETEEELDFSGEPDDSEDLGED